jgi:hypothetical protein
MAEEVATVGNLRAVRTNERMLSSDLGSSHWNMREYRVRAGALAPVALAETPDMKFNGTKEIEQLFAARGNADLETPNSIPESMATGQGAISSFVWEGTAGKSGGAFSQRTCNGCNGGNRPQRRRQRRSFSRILVRARRVVRAMAPYA